MNTCNVSTGSGLKSKCLPVDLPAILIHNIVNSV